MPQFHNEPDGEQRGSNVVLKPMFRVTTFVPPESVDALLEGVAGVVPLRYGQYDRAAWWSSVGVEQFRPLPGAVPTFGEIGRIERVPTVRIEFAIPRDAELLTRVLTLGLLPSHPWHEPAVFIDESQVVTGSDGHEAGERGLFAGDSNDRS